MILNIGSINIDYIYRVPHLVTPGETLLSRSLTTVLGGKGANQSVSLARAGAPVIHIGRVSVNDSWALQEMSAAGVDTTQVVSATEPSGHAIIQVDDAGENSIVLLGGANQQITEKQLLSAFANTKQGDWVLIQNECNALEQVFRLCAQHQLPLVFNPAPMTEAAAKLPLEQCHCLIVNEVEAAAVVGQVDSADHDALAAALLEMFPNTLVALTLGADGVRLLENGKTIVIAAAPVEPIDTTGAGDTFVGYFMAGLVAGKSPVEAATIACHAAALSVTVVGATPSIPSADAVIEFMQS